MASLRPLPKQILAKTRTTLVKQQQRLVNTSTKNNAAAAVATNTVTSTTETKKKKRLVFDNRSPSFQDFLAQHQPPTKQIDSPLAQPDNIPYLSVQGQQLGRGRKFYIEVYGCQVRKIVFLCV